MRKKFYIKWKIALKIFPIVLGTIILKITAHKFGYEIINVSALFTSLVAGTIFLLGFLISGVLADYKESEKLPSELSATIASLYDTAETIEKAKGSLSGKALKEFTSSFLTKLLNWFYRKERTKNILEELDKMNQFLTEIEKEKVQVNYVIKLEADEHFIRKTILRIHTIRETNFIDSAYLIVEVLGSALAIGLIMIKIEPFYEGLFLTSLIIFLIFYMLFLIKDMDNPFDYAENGEEGTEISLKPLHDLEENLKKRSN